MGEPSTAASDRYALAVVAFELLTGSKPFTAENFAAQARAHVEDEPPRPSERDIDVPVAVDRVLERGMAKDPADRWDSAGAMVRALDDALSAPPPRRRTPVAGTGDATRVMGGTTPPARPARAGSPSGAPRRGWGAGAVVALAALLLVVAGAVALISAGGDPEADRNARQQQTPTATPDATSTPAEETPTPTPEAEEPAAPQDEQPGKAKGKEKKSSAAGDDPATLQLQAFELNNAGQPQDALPFAQKAVELCQGSDAVDPCAYALFEYARALRMTGDPQGAIAALEERKQRFPENQPAAVEKELALAREAAGEG